MAMFGAKIGIPTYIIIEEDILMWHKRFIVVETENKKR